MSSERVDFILPDLGEGVHEAEIITWKVKAGDVVDEMDVLAEMETDKALVEVPSPYAGKIIELHGSEGEIAHVGKPIVTFENATQSGQPVGGAGKSATIAETKPNGEAHGAEAAVEAEPEREREDAGTVVGSMEGQPTLGRGDGKVMATPAVRRLAKDLGVEINSIHGTGRGGRVTATDVQKASKGRGNTGSQPSTAPAARKESRREPSYEPPPVKVDANGVAERIPFRGVRRKIAESLDRSVRTAVHFTVMDSADVTGLNRLRRQQASAAGEKVSFLPFVIQAVCRALKRYPNLNANVDDENSEILIKGVQNIGVAVDTDHGLMVPVIPSADRMAVLPLGRKIADLAEKCANRSVPRDELMGGTFTVSNVGSYAGAFATPIINYPEVGILAVGRARETVMARNGAIYIGMEMPLSLSCDHRVVDGAYGARFLAEVVQLLENPETLLEPAGR
ncbi:MAG: dihydrolipoamide acetyltransferase family protein [Phycisphaerales bacterium]